MIPDTELLGRFAENQDEAAFRELVERHVDLVYSAALRQVNGDAHLARDVVQLVFVDLMRKARALHHHQVLAGWLFTSTRFAAAKLVRTEQRRRARELEAYQMHPLTDDQNVDWTRLRPVIDEALADLNAADREAILLRFFEHRDFHEIGTRLNLADNTARMRVERALDKLRSRLAKRGLTSTSVALATVLSTQAVGAAPAGLGASVATVVLAGAGTTGAAAGGAIASFMAMTKLQMGMTGALLAVATTGYVLQGRTNANLRQDVAELQQQTAGAAAVRAENEQLARAAAEAADLKADTASLNQLSAETTDLRSRLQKVAAAAPSPRSWSGGEVFDVSKVDQIPRPISRQAPRYPAELRNAGTTGEVVIEFVVNESGLVQDLKVVRSTHAEFEEPALEAIAAWKFSPGIKGGQPVNVRMQVPIVFSLNQKGESRSENRG
jgi:RNA polymerase sigma factor (sigma-70 family)